MTGFTDALMTASQAGLSWSDSLASIAVGVTAIIVLLGIELRWAELVATAQSRGLVAVSARD